MSDIRMEKYPLANTEFQHIGVRTQVFDHVEALDNAMIEVNQLGF